MTDFQKIVDRYLQIWNETDPPTRRAAIDDLFTDDVTFVDPMAEVEGQAGVDNLIAAVQAQFPGYVLTQLGTVDGHHDQARFGWEMGLPGQAPQVAGSDVVALAADGRIRQVFGFLDMVPA